MAFDNQGDPVQSGGGISSMTTNSNTVIHARHLSKTYGNGSKAPVRAVSNVAFTAKRGEVLLIRGPNGSGKTTLLSMLGCMISPSRGSLLILGENVTHLSQRRLTEFRIKHIGFVFQTFRLLDALTVLENVELPMNLGGMRQPDSSRKAKALLEEFDLLHRAGFYPQALSGGEKQRVAVARAFANDPSMILADEPTGSLDSRSGKAAVESLCSAARRCQTTVLIVSHDGRIEPVADRVFGMEDGRLKGGKAL
jgi:putative ABC transport system ATP-binding protein